MEMILATQEVCIHAWLAQNVYGVQRVKGQYLLQNTNKAMVTLSGKIE